MRDIGDILGGGSEAAVIIEPQPGDSALTLPDGAYLAAADFSRLGSDLVLQAEGHPSVLVRGYFESAEPPALLSPQGAKFGPELVAKLAGPLAPGQIAQAAAGSGGEVIGEVTELTGTARVTRTNGVEEELALGDPVYLGDVLATGPESSVGITFVDDTLFSLGADARLVLNTLIFDPGGDSNTLAVSLVTGAFTLISGQISGADGPGISIETPVATIGVRGTTLAGIYDALLHALTATLLEFNEEVGNFEMYNAVSVQSAFQALHTLFASSQTESIGAPTTATAEQLAEYARALASATRSFIIRLQRLEPEAGPDQDGQDGGGGGGGNGPDPFDAENVGQDFGEADEGLVDPGIGLPIDLADLLELFELDPNLLLLLGLGFPDAVVIVISLARGLETEDGGEPGLEAGRIDLNVALGAAPGPLGFNLTEVPSGVTVVSESTGLFFFNDTDEPQTVPLTLADLDGLAVIPPDFADDDFTLLFLITAGGELLAEAVIVNVQGVADLAEVIFNALDEPLADPLALLAQLQDFAGLNEIQTELEGQGRIGVNETTDELTGDFLGAQDLGALDAAETGRALTVNGWAGLDPNSDPELDLLPVPDVDVYKVTLTAGTYQFDIDFANQDENNEPDAKGRIDAFDARLIVYDAEGNEIDRHPDEAGENPFLELEIAEAGMYFVVVTPFINVPNGSTFQEGFTDTSEEGDDFFGDYQLQIRGDEGPILPGAHFHQIEVEDNAVEEPEGSGMFLDPTDPLDLIKETGFIFRVGEQIEDGGDVIVGPDGSESITRIEFTVKATNEGEGFGDLPGFMLDFGGGSGFVSEGDTTVDIRARLFGQTEFETVQAELIFLPAVGLYVLTFPESLRVQEVDMEEIAWKVDRHDDHDFDLEVIVRSTETHPNEPIGIIFAVDGEPTATRTTNDGEIVETLGLTDGVFFLDTITTGPGESLRFLLIDGTEGTIGPNETVLLDEDFFDPMLGADTAGFGGNPDQVAVPHNYQSFTLSLETKAIADKPLLTLEHVCVVEDTGEEYEPGPHGPQDGSEGPLTVTSKLTANVQDTDGTESLHKIVLSVSDVDLFSPDLALSGFKLFIDGEEIEFTEDFPQTITIESATLFAGGEQPVVAEVNLVGTTLEITFPENDETGDDSILGLMTEIDIQYPRHEAEDFTLKAEVTTKELNPFGEVEVLTQTDSIEASIQVKEVADVPLVSLTSVCVIEDTGEAFIGEGEHGQQSGEEGDSTAEGGPPLSVMSTLTINEQDRDGSQSIKQIVLSLSNVDLSDPTLSLSDFGLMIDESVVNFALPFPQTITLDDVTLFEDGVEVTGESIEAEVNVVGETLVITFPTLGTVEEPAEGTLAFKDDAILDIVAEIKLTYPQHEAEDFDLTATVTTIELNPDGAVAVSEATAEKTANIEIKEVADAPEVTLTSVCVIEDTGGAFIGEGEHGQQSGEEGDGTAEGGPPLSVISTLSTNTQDRDGSETLSKAVLTIASGQQSLTGLQGNGYVLMIDGQEIDIAGLSSEPQMIDLTGATLFFGGPSTIKGLVSIVGETLEITFPDNDAFGDDSVLDLETEIKLTYPQHEADNFTIDATVTTHELNPDGTKVAKAFATASAETATIDVKEVADAPEVTLTSVCVSEDTGDVFLGIDAHDQQSGEEGDGTVQGGPPLSVISTLSTNTQDQDGSESLSEIVLTIAGEQQTLTGLQAAGYVLMIDGQEIDIAGLSTEAQEIDLTGATLFAGGATTIKGLVAIDGETLVITFPDNDAEGDDSILDLVAEIKLTYPQHEADDFTIDATVTTHELNPDGTVAQAFATASAETAAIEVKEVADAPEVTLTSVCVIGDTGEGSSSGQQDGSEGEDPQLNVVSTLTTNTQDRDGSESLSEIVLTIAGAQQTLTGLQAAGYVLMIDDQEIDIAGLSTSPQEIDLTGATLFTGGPSTIKGLVAIDGETLVITFPDNDEEDDDSILDLVADIKLTYPQHEADDFTIDATVTVKELNPDGDDVAQTFATASAETATIQVKEIADAPEVTLTSVCVIEDTGVDFANGPHLQQDGSEGDPTPLSVVSTLSTNTQDVDGSESLSKIALTIASVQQSLTGLQGAGYVLMIDGQEIDIAGLSTEAQEIDLTGATLFAGGATTIKGLVAIDGETLVITFPENDEEGNDSILDLVTEIKLTYPQHEADDFTIDATVTVKELNPDGDVGFVEATASAVQASVEVKEVADEATVTAADVTVCEDDGSHVVGDDPVYAVPIKVEVTDKDGSESITKLTIGSSAVSTAGGEITYDGDPIADLFALNGDGDGDPTTGTLDFDVETAIGSMTVTAEGMLTADGVMLTFTASDRVQEIDTSLLGFRLPEHKEGEFQVDWSIVTTETDPDGDPAVPKATATGDLTLTVEADADAATVTAADVTVCEDDGDDFIASDPVYKVPLRFEVTDTDGSESITEVTFSSAAAAAFGGELTYDGGSIAALFALNGDGDGDPTTGTLDFDVETATGSTTVTAEATLVGGVLTLSFAESDRVQILDTDLLGIRMPEHKEGVYQVDWSVTTTETDPMDGAVKGDPESETVTGDLTLTIEADADAATVTAADVTVCEDDGDDFIASDPVYKVPLRFEVTDTDGSESITEVSLSSAAAAAFGGALTYDGTLISDIFALDGDGDGDPTTGTLDFDVETATGSTTVTAEATLVGGVLTLSFAESDRIQILDTDLLGIRMPEHKEGIYQVDWSVTTTETDPMDDAVKGDPESETLTGDLTLTIEADADAAAVTLPDIVVPETQIRLLYCEDNANEAVESQIFGLPLTASVVDTDGSEGISQIELMLSGFTAGEFVAWTHLGDPLSGTTTRTINGVTVEITVSSQTLTIDYLDALGDPIDEAPLSAVVSEIGVQVAEHYSGTFTVGYEVTSKEVNPMDDAVKSDPETATTSGNYGVRIEGVADAPTLTKNNIEVAEDSPGKVQLDLTPALVDTDGSETMVVTVTGIPDDWTYDGVAGGTFVAGAVPGTKTWTSDSIGPLDVFVNPTFMPPEHFNTAGGSRTFNAKVTTTESSPVKSGSETAMTSMDFTVTITPTNDPVSFVSSGDPDMVDEDDMVMLAGLEVTDVDALLNPGGTYKLTVATSDGTVSIGGAPAAATAMSTGQLDQINTALGQIKFFPTEDYNGPATVTVTVTDEVGSTIATGTADPSTVMTDVPITVKPVNDAPVANPDEDETDEDTPIGIDILGNDSDVDSSPITIDPASLPAFSDMGAALSIVGDRILYDPTVSATLQALPDGASVDDTFTYKASDGSLLSDAALVTVAVAGVNDPATITSSASDAMGTVGEIDDTATGNLGVDDIDTGENIFQALAGGGAGTYGTLSFSTDGSWIYTLNQAAEDAIPEGTSETDSFTVFSADGTASETIVITIEGNLKGVPSLAFGYVGPDPIFLDLGEEGVGFASGDSEWVAFDLDADGVAEHIAWPNSEDGLLVVDHDSSGQIEDGSEVFSPDFAEGGFKDALDALVSLDDNGDGVIDAQDAAFQAIKLWIDGNVDGVTDEGELTSLDEQGIVAIDLETTAVDLEVDGQEVYAEGSYILESGEARQFIAVNLDQAAGSSLGTDAVAEAPTVNSVLPAILRSDDNLTAQQSELPDLANLAALRRAGQFVQRGDFVTGAYALVPLVAAIDSEWASVGLRGSVDAGGDSDVYAFLARADETVRIDALTAAPGTRIELRGSDGSLLMADDGGASGGGDLPGSAEVTTRSLSVTTPADGLIFAVVRESGTASIETGPNDYLLAMSIELDGDNDAEFRPLEPGQTVNHVIVDADHYLALGEPIPIDLLLSTADTDGSERLYELEVSGFEAGGSLSYLDASGALVTVVDGSAADGDGLQDGRITLDLTQYEGSSLATGPGGRLTSLATGEAGIDLRLHEDAIDDADMALMIKAVSQEIGATGAAEFAEELVTVDVIVSGVSSILVDATGENALQGGAGDDLILGGLGADLISGGAGSDTFIYRAGDGGPTIAGADTILDFQDGVDLIGLADGLSYAGLSIADSALGAVISSGSETLAIVTGTPAVDLTSDDFVSVSV